MVYLIMPVSIYPIVCVYVKEIGEVWEVSVGLCDVLLGGYLDQMLSME